MPQEAPPTYPNARATIRDQSDFEKYCRAFFRALLCFTPTNLALLTFVAGLIGGYASNIHLATMPEDKRQEIANIDANRITYLQEPPMNAAIRGFVVYLCVIAGLYLGLDDPFRNTTSGQYVRLAGMMSVLAFTVGYDATRLNSWLGIILNPGQKTPPATPPTNPPPK
jgi:hypothetical protein